MLRFYHFFPYVSNILLSLFYLRTHNRMENSPQTNFVVDNIKFIKYADSQVGFIRSFLIFVKVDLNKCWRKDLSGEWLAVLEFNNIYDLFS